MNLFTPYDPDKQLKLISQGRLRLFFVNIVQVEGRREKLRRLEQELEQELQGQQQLLAQQLDTLKQTRDQFAHMKKLSLVSHFPCYSIVNFRI